MAKKRILIFSTAYLPLIGGAEVAVAELTDRLTDCEFFMITARLQPELPRYEEMGNIKVYRLGQGNNLDKYRLILNGWKKAQELGKFDVVWSIMASYAGFAALRYQKKNPGTKFLLTLQEGDSRWDIYKHVWWCWPIFTQIFKCADTIQTISSYLADWASALGAKCPIEVIPNGVAREKFFNKTGEILKIKFGLGIEESAKVVVTTSRLVKKNGVGDLINAMQFLEKNIHLLILGNGELEDELKLLSKQNNLENQVHFLGNISQNELPQYLWASDVFCRPSLSEGLGIAFLEALAAGVPVVATKVGGIPDFLQDRETGLFCAVNNPQDIANKIKEILDDQELRNKLVTNGKKLVEKKYSWDIIAEQIKNIFNKLCVS